MMYLNEAAGIALGLLCLMPAYTLIQIARGARTPDVTGIAGIDIEDVVAATVLVLCGLGLILG